MKPLKMSKMTLLIILALITETCLTFSIASAEAILYSSVNSSNSFDPGSINKKGNYATIWTMEDTGIDTATQKLPNYSMRKILLEFHCKEKQYRTRLQSDVNSSIPFTAEKMGAGATENEKADGAKAKDDYNPKSLWKPMETSFEIEWKTACGVPSVPKFKSGWLKLGELKSNSYFESDPISKGNYKRLFMTSLVSDFSGNSYENVRTIGLLEFHCKEKQFREAPMGSTNSETAPTPIDTHDVGATEEEKVSFARVTEGKVILDAPWQPVYDEYITEWKIACGAKLKVKVNNMMKTAH